LRILQVSPAYYPAIRYGGPIRSIHGLSATLARRGHDVHVYTTTMDGACDLDVPTDRPVMLDGVAIHYFPVPALRRLCWSPSMGARLRRDIDRFDVAHLHSVYLWPTWAAARCAHKAGVPYLISPRGMLVRSLIERRSRWVKKAWINLIERNSLARTAGVHVTADLEAEDVRDLGLRLPAVFCVPNGVGWPERPAPLSAGPFAGVPERYALFLSRLHPKKGLDRLIRAWRWVPQLALVIAGNDEEGYRAQLEALAAREGVSGRVHFVGPASDTDKWALYQNAQLFILPSYSENFGNVVAEAMAMSCPVVLTPEVGLAQLVGSAGAGMITSGEPQSLAEAVNALYGDSARRKEMGRRGRDAVRDLLSWDAVAAQMEAVYRQVRPCAQPLTA